MTIDIFIKHEIANHKNGAIFKRQSTCFQFQPAFFMFLGDKNQKLEGHASSKLKMSYYKEAWQLVQDFDKLAASQ